MTTDSIPDILSLGQLCEELRLRFGENFDITQHEYGDGSSETKLYVEGDFRASWKGRLKKIPPFDGVTPRGEKEYYDIQFFNKTT